jgi:hypothetical protein
MFTLMGTGAEKRRYSPAMKLKPIEKPRWARATGHEPDFGSGQKKNALEIV